LPSRTHCWNRRWHVWYGGYLLGSSRHCAPVPSTHNTPFNTARVSRQGRPRPSLRRAGCRIGSKTDHSASLTSQRPRIGFWSYQSYPSICPKFAANKRENSRHLFMGQVLVKSLVLLIGTPGPPTDIEVEVLSSHRCTGKLQMSKARAAWWASASLLSPRNSSPKTFEPGQP
jgi:hypothetical protein